MNNNTRNRGISIAVLLSCLLGSVVAVAADPPPQGNPPAPITATVVKFEGRVLVIKTADHKDMSLTLPADASIIESRPTKLSDLRSGEFIGTTAVKGKDGKMHSREIHIFPESMRGTREGHGPLDNPDTTMTNGKVATMTNGAVSAQGKNDDSVILKVTYKGGEQEIEAGPDVSVTRMVPGDVSSLKPGVHIVTFAEQINGGWVARQVVATASAP